MAANLVAGVTAKQGDRVRTEQHGCRSHEKDCIIGEQEQCHDGSGVHFTHGTMHTLLTFVAACTLLAAVPGAAASVPAPRSAVSQDSAAVAAAVHAFHAALAAGDSTAALQLLADHAVILESGGLENRDEYRAHHLPADIAFAGAVSTERGEMQVIVRGDVAWTSSTSIANGQYRGRPVHSAGAELMVLERTPEGWRIAAIHWSSRAHRE